MDNIINIKDNKDRRFQFMISVSEDGLETNNRFKVIDSISKIDYVLDEDDYAQMMYLSDYGIPTYAFSDENNVYILTRDDFTDIEIEENEDDTVFNTNTSRIRVYIPDMNPSRYNKTLYYHIYAWTSIGRRQIMMHSDVISAKDFLASERLKRVGQYIYSNYYEFDVLDPFDLYFGPQFLSFRKRYCYTGDDNTDNSAGIDITDSTPIINVGIRVVEKISDDEYMTSTNYGFGTSSLIPESYNELNPDVRLSFTDRFVSDVTVRDIFTDLTDYVRRSYSITPEHIDYEFSILDSDNIFRLFRKENISRTDMTIDLNSDEVYDEMNPYLQDKFSGWEEYSEGMFAQCVYIIYSDGEPRLFLKSNKLIVDRDIFRFLINDPVKINIDEIDMNINEIKITNRIEKNVIQLQNHDTGKENMLRPVFYKSYTSDTITLNRPSGVIQNIAITVDKQINLVERFTLSINGFRFNEIARQFNQVLFSIDGTSAIDLDSEGNKISEIRYFLVDGNNEVFAEGKCLFPSTVLSSAVVPSIKQTIFEK